MLASLARGGSAAKVVIGTGGIDRRSLQKAAPWTLVEEILREFEARVRNPAKTKQPRGGAHVRARNHLVGE